MRRWFVLAAALMFTCGLSAISPPALAQEKPAEKPRAEKPDSERIVATWNYVSTDRKNPLFDNEGQSVQLKFDATDFSLVVLKDGGKILEIGGTYSIDSVQTPKLLDLTVRGGDGGANFVFAIYEFKGNQLRIRVRDNNGQRPADFESQADDCQILTFKLEQPSK